MHRVKGTIRLALLAILPAVIPCGIRSQETTGDVPEYHLKAVFLYNFARFVEWPREKLGSADRPIVIGVLDIEPMEDALPLFEGKKAQGRNVELRECSRIDEMQACHVLFLNTPDDLLIKRILHELADKPVVTVGERKGFTRWGGVMNFYKKGPRVRLEADPEAARRAGIRLSAQLLELARIAENQSN